MRGKTRSGTVRRTCKEFGAKGLKFRKTLGLAYHYKDGRLMTVDRSSSTRSWDMSQGIAGRWSSTSPTGTFFTPLDRFNERWHELNKNPASSPTRPDSRSGRTCSINSIASSPSTRRPPSSTRTSAITPKISHRSRTSSTSTRTCTWTSTPASRSSAANLSRHASSS